MTCDEFGEVFWGVINPDQPVNWQKLTKKLPNNNSNTEIGNCWRQLLHSQSSLHCVHEFNDESCLCLIDRTMCEKGSFMSKNAQHATSKKHPTEKDDGIDVALWVFHTNQGTIFW